MAEEIWTVQKLIQWTAEFFQSKKIDSARVDAELLLANALKIRRLDLYLKFSEVVPSPSLDRFREMVKRRGRFEPVAYILGEREFFGRKFGVEPGVLIPRPETELMVEAVLNFLTETQTKEIAIQKASQSPQPQGVAAQDASPVDEALNALMDDYAEDSETDEAPKEKLALLQKMSEISKRKLENKTVRLAKLGPKTEKLRKVRLERPQILDVGAGSGCVGLSLALEIPNAQVVLVEKSEKAASVIQKNISSLGASNVTLKTADFAAGVDLLPKESFDVVVSNPPYIGLAEKESLPKDVVDFEPAEALFGGTTGDELILSWINIFERVAKPGALVMFEMGMTQGDKLLRAVQESGKFTSAEIVKDYSHRPRFIKAIKSNHG